MRGRVKAWLAQAVPEAEAAASRPSPSITRSGQQGARGHLLHSEMLPKHSSAGRCACRTFAQLVLHDAAAELGQSAAASTDGANAGRAPAICRCHPVRAPGCHRVWRQPKHERRACQGSVLATTRTEHCHITSGTARQLPAAAERLPMLSAASGSTPNPGKAPLLTRPRRRPSRWAGQQTAAHPRRRARFPGCEHRVPEAARLHWGTLCAQGPAHGLHAPRHLC